MIWHCLVTDMVHESTVDGYDYWADICTHFVEVLKCERV